MHIIHLVNIKNFDLNLLVVFKTLYEERNVTKASKKIGITQRVHTICEYQEHRDELDQNWSRLLNEKSLKKI